MKTTELKDKVTVYSCGSGQYKVVINYRGHDYSCMSNNSVAWDDLNSHDGEKVYYTYRQALLSFWDECKDKNGLR